MGWYLEVGPLAGGQVMREVPPDAMKTLIKETQSAPSSRPCEDAICESGRQFSPDTKSSVSLISDFQFPEP